MTKLPKWAALICEGMALAMLTGWAFVAGFLVGLDK